MSEKKIDVLFCYIIRNDKNKDCKVIATNAKDKIYIYQQLVV